MRQQVVGLAASLFGRARAGSGSTHSGAAPARRRFGQVSRRVSFPSSICCKTGGHSANQPAANPRPDRASARQMPRELQHQQDDAPQPDRVRPAACSPVVGASGDEEGSHHGDVAVNAGP